MTDEASTKDRRLDHVLWLGGSACAGKTSVGRLLAADHGLDLYSCDDHFAAHCQRADPQVHPAFCRVMDLKPEELWTRPPEEGVARLLAFYEDELAMVLEDLAALPVGRPVLAEGAGLLPQLLAARLARPLRALWLVSAGDFRRRLYPRRGPWVASLLKRCEDPPRAFEVWMTRDDLFAAEVIRGAAGIDGKVLEVDGRRSLEETAAEVARHLGVTAPHP